MWTLEPSGSTEIHLQKTLIWHNTLPARRESKFLIANSPGIVQSGDLSMPVAETWRLQLSLKMAKYLGWILITGTFLILIRLSLKNLLIYAHFLSRDTFLPTKNNSPYFSKLSLSHLLDLSMWIRKSKGVWDRLPKKEN